MIVHAGDVSIPMLAFLSTTVDDFAVVLIFFAREYQKDIPLSRKSFQFYIVAFGQFVGFIIIVSVSLLLGTGLRAVVPSDYMDCIGFLPIAFGIYKAYVILSNGGLKMETMWNCFHYSAKETKLNETSPLISDDKQHACVPSVKNEDNSSFSEGLIDVSDDEESSCKPSTKDKDNASLHCVSPQLVPHDEFLDDINEIDNSSFILTVQKYMSCCYNALFFEVMMYALMFGTDNIAIYVALFSDVSYFIAALYTIMFYGLLVVYTCLALLLVIKVCCVHFMSNKISPSIIICLCLVALAW